MRNPAPKAADRVFGWIGMGDWWHLGFWDAALLIVVTAQGLAVAYLHAPKWKLLVMSLPFPLTLGSLALDVPLDATHVVGLAMFVAFTHAVRALHYGGGVRILAAIAIAALGHVAISSVLARIIPTGDLTFWIALAVVGAAAAVLVAVTGRREEGGSRSPLSPWAKVPAMGSLIFALIAAKQALRGFMPMFPMMGVVTAYEGRRCLWGMSRQAHGMAVAMAIMMAVVRLTQGPLGLGSALAIGWVVYLPICLVVSWRLWSPAPRNKNKPLPQLKMIWPSHRLDSPPEVSLQAGYKLRAYRDDDQAAYLELMTRAGFDGWTEQRLAESRQPDLPGGLLVVEHVETGALVATARAQDKPREGHPQGGEMGWVAGCSRHNGRGLGAAVTAAATAKLLESGCRDIYLLTDDWRLAAIKCYLRVGYVPVLADGPTADRWAQVCRTLDWPFTPERW